MGVPLLLLVLQVCVVWANTEKVIFLGPETLEIPAQHPSLEDLQLDVLSLQHSSLRTHIRAEFPSNTSEYGVPSWYLLRGLQEGQRYEVRICWAATEPTSFRLETYELPMVFASPELITSLAQYSESRQPEMKDVEPSITRKTSSTNIRDETSAFLFLQIHAAADYFTMNQTLMEHVPPVHVDIILDPYLLNIFPRSLVPTAAHIILIAIGGWQFAKHVRRQLLAISMLDTETESKKTR